MCLLLSAISRGEVAAATQGPKLGTQAGQWVRAAPSQHPPVTLSQVSYSTLEEKMLLEAGGCCLGFSILPRAVSALSCYSGSQFLCPHVR